MKFCAMCGTQLVDEALVCTGCGCAASKVLTASTDVAADTAKKSGSGLTTAAKVFMILGTVVMGLEIIPLAWCLPMTISYCRKVQNGLPIGTGFKVCSLLFVSMVGGILMLCDNEH